MKINNYPYYVATLIFIIINIQTAFANDQIEFNKVQKTLSQQNTICGDFKQIRHIELLSKPLISHGRFYLSKNEGLTWIQQKPFKSVLTLTNDKMTQQIENNPPMIMTKASQPIVFSFTNIFLSLFSGHFSIIKRYFNLNFTGTTTNWQLKLTPNSSPINKAIINMTVSGSDKVNQIMVNQVDNNQMKIDFTNIKLNEKRAICLE